MALKRTFVTGLAIGLAVATAVAAAAITYERYDTKTLKRTVKRDEQGDRVRESEALFDYKEKKVIYIETDPNDAMRAPRVTGSTLCKLVEG